MGARGKYKPISTNFNTLRPYTKITNVAKFY